MQLSKWRFQTTECNRDCFVTPDLFYAWLIVKKKTYVHIALNYVNLYIKCQWKSVLVYLQSIRCHALTKYTHELPHFWSSSDFFYGHLFVEDCKWLLIISSDIPILRLQKVIFNLVDVLFHISNTCITIVFKFVITN